MHVDGDAGRLKEKTEEPGWEVDPNDDWGVAVVETVGRQLKLRREAMGMRAADFAAAVGYGEDLVYKIEGGKRIPRQEFLDKADEALGAGGLISATWEDVKRVRYPKKVRALGQMEAKAVEIGGTSATSSLGCCRRLSMPGRPSRRPSLPTPRTMWTEWWPVAWPGSPSLSVTLGPRSVSCWKRRR